MNKNKLRCFIPLIVASPSVIIGAITMGSNNIPRMTFGQNIICLFFGWLISCYFISSKTEINKTVGKIFIVLVLYVFTFINLGIGGVHRWVSLGPIRLYLSSIFIPVLIIELWRLLMKNRELVAVFITVVITILLILQPDASQLTAFAIPMIIILFNKFNKKIICYIIISLLSIGTIISWVFLDSLPAVSYVEEIISLVLNMGMIWFVLGIISLVILPLPFIVFPKEGVELLSRCIGLYFIIVIITTFFGNFPVPLMGYGISPIIGYFIAITWLLKSNNEIEIDNLS
ncbi:hypothetical protein AN1V17_16550 [Vallitalea sediminicola]